MTARIGRVGLAIVLLIHIGWPLAATVLTAAQGEDSAHLGGGIALARPLGLAAGTLRVVGLAEALALPAGVGLALLIFRTDLWGRRVLLALLMLALFVPMPLHATAWLGSFGNAGRSQAIGSRPLLVGWSGAAVVHAIAALPWVVLMVGVGLIAVEPELEEAARLDLPAWRVALRVTLRRSVGAIAAAALAVAVLTANDMTVTDLLQVRSYAEEVYTQAHLVENPAAAARVALPPLAVLGVAILVGARKLLRTDPARLASAWTRGRAWRLGAWRVPLGLAVLLTVGNMAALPIYGLAWRAGRVGGSAARGVAPRWSVGGLLGTLTATAPELVGPMGKSLLWAGVGATLAVAIAWPLAWASRRAGPWRWVAAVVVALMLATPGPIVGIALMLAFNPPLPAQGAGRLALLVFDLRAAIYDSPAVLAIALAVRTLPYALLVLWPSVRGLPEAHLEAAALDGLGPWGLAWRVAWPLGRGALLAAWGVAFVLAMGELPASLMVDGPSWTPLITVRIWRLLHTGVESHLAGVGLLMLLALGLVGLAAAWALGRLFASDRRFS